MLTGQDLADAYAAAHPLSHKNPGKVRAVYDGGGWIVILGSGLKPHPDLAEQYPNGWELFERMRSGVVRQELADNFAELRQEYAKCGYDTCSNIMPQDKQNDKNQPKQD